MFRHFTIAQLLLLLLLSWAEPAVAQPHLQCVPYARAVSGIDIHGNADRWWDEAAGLYQRGPLPKVGAVLAFRSTDAMPFGHVAVVQKVIDDRHILLDHANWSGPGVIEHHALAVDVSAEGDWSEVRVWYAPISALGIRDNPTYGFIYDSLVSDPDESDEQLGSVPAHVADNSSMAVWGMI